MESDFDPRQALAASDRAAASSWIDYPPTPRWYAPAVGVWATGLAAAIALLDGVVASLALLGLVLVMVAFTTWYRRYRGTMPAFRGAPPEMRRLMVGFVVGYALLVLVVAAAVAWLPGGVALVLTFVLVTTAVALYERRYADAAAAARARLG